MSTRPFWLGSRKTSSEVELMETGSTCQTRARMTRRKTSSEVELMETHLEERLHTQSRRKTSSEVELMETGTLPRTAD